MQRGEGGTTSVVVSMPEVGRKHHGASVASPAVSLAGDRVSVWRRQGYTHPAASDPVSYYQRLRRPPGDPPRRHGESSSASSALPPALPLSNPPRRLGVRLPERP